MMTIRQTAILSVVASLFLFSVPLFAQDFDIPWSTIDCGGETLSAGGNFDLSGTIGQSDATAALTGGVFELTGGFWTEAPNGCECPGDMTSDLLVNGRDIQGFVTCLLTSAGICECADFNGDSGLDLTDVTGFVDSLLINSGCP